MTVPPRVIPVLLISDGYLVKTMKFGKPRYVGDPINAVKIFNEKQVDELIICDIDATSRSTAPDLELLEAIASEAFMPVGYGGGIRTAADARRVLELGMEKLILNSLLRTGPEQVREISAAVGAQSVLASIDVRRDLLGRQSTFTNSGTIATGVDPAAFARESVALGVGEIIVTSIDREGTGAGYDIELVRQVSAAVTVPVIALGGAASDADFVAALAVGASAVAAGSRFVFHGKHKAVLITYPDPSAIEALKYSAAG
ncbi:AglZ/HisF2 family acetamidino modification protein [Cryobacterium sp. Sr3]|uniref:AglZ/HisF2 family acetamidino modification protein n=1 Tax=Cryobacterium sp. Sr3 TaxID=1259194 RepID=UPI00106925B0|nr:AglZ/HisF2 family acetamidino modification protein [Cryobacterium sp. Sr3]TFB55264.1 imidazole glycerol phosphate synthase subunit HisF [Cryobacterium sp. Sr3]